MAYTYNTPLPYNENIPYDFVGSWGGAGNPPPNIPHLNAVMRLGNDGTFLAWQQGTIDEVAQSVEVVCGTAQGDRTVVPTFGIPQLAFTISSSGQPQQAIEQAVNAWEPRATVQIKIAQNGQGADPVITVNTSLRKGSTAN